MDVNVRSSLTRAAAHVLRDDASEVPEARLAAVALLTSDPGLAGALAGGGVAGALIGAVGVAMAGAWKRRDQEILKPLFYIYLHNLALLFHGTFSFFLHFFAPLLFLHLSL